MILDTNNNNDDSLITLTVLSSPIDVATTCTGYSVFTEQVLSLSDYNGLFITPRIDALNFRHRLSKPDYVSDWHVAGDPTLIIIRTGTLRLTLRNGEYKDFSAGDMFIAEDRLQAEEVFDENIHGHRATVIGQKILTAVHIKLSQ